MFAFSVLAFLIDIDPKPFLLRLFRNFKTVEDADPRHHGLLALLLNVVASNGVDIPEYTGNILRLEYEAHDQFCSCSFPTPNAVTGEIGFKQWKTNLALLLEDIDGQPLFDENVVDAMQSCIHYSAVVKPNFKRWFLRTYGAAALPHAALVSAFLTVNGTIILDPLLKNDPDVVDHFCLKHVVLFGIVARSSRRDMFIHDLPLSIHQDETVLLEVAEVLVSLGENVSSKEIERIPCTHGTGGQYHPSIHLDTFQMPYRYMVTLIADHCDIDNRSVGFQCKMNLCFFKSIYPTPMEPCGFTHRPEVLLAVVDRLFRDQDWDLLYFLQACVTFVVSKEMDEFNDKLVLRIVKDLKVPVRPLIRTDPHELSFLFENVFEKMVAQDMPSEFFERFEKMVTPCFALNDASAQQWARVVRDEIVARKSSL
jgi:hypothetical protein